MESILWSIHVLDVVCADIREPEPAFSHDSAMPQGTVMEGILTFPMPAFAPYSPNPGIDRQDNYGTDGESRVDDEYDWLYGNSIFSELLCIIYVMGRSLLRKVKLNNRRVRCSRIGGQRAAYPVFLTAFHQTVRVRFRTYSFPQKT